MSWSSTSPHFYFSLSLRRRAAAAQLSRFYSDEANWKDKKQLANSSQMWESKEEEEEEEDEKMKMKVMKEKKRGWVG